MIRGLFNDNTNQVLHTALDGLARRQQVTANNIANAETPGFKASIVTFESQLHARLPGATHEPVLAQTHPAHLSAQAQPAG
ncbi:MAG: flagellar basal-body rod protein FlgB, partial [Chloroflexi bacterium RBG_16_57_9]